MANVSFHDRFDREPSIQQLVTLHHRLVAWAAARGIAIGETRFSTHLDDERTRIPGRPPWIGMVVAPQLTENPLESQP